MQSFITYDSDDLWTGIFGCDGLSLHHASKSQSVVRTCWWGNCRLKSMDFFSGLYIISLSRRAAVVWKMNQINTQVKHQRVIFL